MQKHLLEKYIKPTIIDLASKLTTEWSDDTAMQLHETLGDYLELSTCEHLSRKDEPTPKPKQIPFVAVGNGEPNPYELKGTCLKKAPEGMPAYITLKDEDIRKHTRRPRGAFAAMFEKLFKFMTKPENLGKPMVISPEDIGMSIEDLRTAVTKFNYSKWREDNCPNSKIRYKHNLMNVACQMVRADEDLRGKRFVFN